MKNLIFILFLILSFGSWAQNYNCFQPAAKYFFITGQGDVRGIRIDSVRSSGSDTIFYPYRTARISNYLPGPGSTDSFGGSWVGKKVIKQGNGTFLFDNIWDTVVIRSQAHTGDTWVFFNDTFSIYYTATITSEDTMTILGVPDSIKKITIAADSTGGVPYPIDPVNGFQIILSKNHGFVQVFDLYTFPYHRPDTISFHLPHWYNIRNFDYYLDVLLGNLGTCDLGCFHDNPPTTNNSVFHLFPFHNPSHMEINNFAAGDVYEAHFSSGSYPSIFDSYTLDSVFGKTISISGISYSGTEHKITINTDYSSIPPTFTKTYSSGPYSLNADTSTLASKQYMPEERTGGYILHYFPHLHPVGPSCDSPATYVMITGISFWYNGIATIALIDSDSYSLGYGITSKIIYSTADIEQSTLLCYYSKDSANCGGFVNASPTIVPAISNVSNMAISPNPASSLITISTNAPLAQNTIISVYDITGRAVYHTNTFIQSTFSIKTSEWINGLYMVTIQDDKGTILKEKVVIFH